MQAIFTSENDQRGYALPAVGLVALAGGAAIWVWGLQNLRTSVGVAISPELASSTLTLVSLGMLIVLAGLGLCIYSLAMRRTRLGSYRIGSSVYSNEATLESTNESMSVIISPVHDRESIENLGSTVRVSKTVFAAIVQSLVLVALYAGLVRGYKASVSMQTWVHTNFALGAYLLNYEGVLVIAGLLGVLMFRFLPRRRFSE